MIVDMKSHEKNRTVFSYSLFYTENSLILLLWLEVSTIISHIKSLKKLRIPIYSLCTIQFLYTQITDQ